MIHLNESRTDLHEKVRKFIFLMRWRLRVDKPDRDQNFVKKEIFC